MLTQNRGGGAHHSAFLPWTGSLRPAAYADKSPEQEAIPQAYSRIPIVFTPNRGQLDPQVAYYGQGAGGIIYFTRTGVVFDFIQQETPDGGVDHPEAASLGAPAPFGLEVPRLTLRQDFVGANRNPRIEGKDLQRGKVNIFRGQDPSKWLRALPGYESVIYRDLYPGIDLTLMGHAGGIKYEFHVKPGADSRKIEVAYAGVDGLVLNEAGDLVIGTAFGRLIDARPVSYQQIDGRRVEVPSRFRIQGSASYGFEVEAHDPRYPLIIDPSLVFSGYLGGASVDTGRGITTDAVGNVYVTGETLSSDFPNTAGVTSYGGSFDTFVAKLDASGSTLLYSTFLGGSDSDMGWGIAVDALGNAYVTGGTRSADFPTTSGAVSRALSGPWDAFVAKLDTTGSVLLYGTFLGGIDADIGYGVSVDGEGNAYVTGDTRSPDFPVTAGAFDTTCGTDGDCNPRPDNGVRTSSTFVTKLDPGAGGAAGLVYSTFIDGGVAYGIAVDAAGNAYVTGNGASVAKLDPGGASLLYRTSLAGVLSGRGSSDRGNAIAVDAFGNAYVTGSTESFDFFTTPGAFDESCGTDGRCNSSSSGIGDDAFVAKLDSSGAVLYSTFLGGSGRDAGSGIAVDASGNAYVTGSTESADFPTTPFAFDRTYKGGLFGVTFLVALHPTGMGLRYGTFLGSNSFGSGIAVDATGDVYLTGSTAPFGIPTTSGAWDTTFNGLDDAFVMKFRPPSSLTSIFVDPSNPRMALGQTQQFKAWGSFNDGSGRFLPMAFNPSGSLNLERSNAQAVRLRDGRVLVTGGEDSSGLAVDPAEIYNPATAAWSLTGGMITPRYGHTATRLSSGKVLVSGGVASAECASDTSAELYDPAWGTWGPTGRLNVARHAATATLLLNGKVLVAGGGDRCGGVFSSAELYDPVTGTWSFTGSMTLPREHHSTVLLGSGKVLILGGDGGGPLFAPLSSAEIYDPATGTWSPTGSMNIERMTGCLNFVQPFAVLLADGRVLAAGGVTGVGLCGGATTASTEIYDPATGIWTLTGGMNEDRAAHTITLLATGEVLAAGGTGSVAAPSGSTELYDPSTGTWSVIGDMITARSGHTATLLSSGDVLMVGGSGVLGPLSAVERVNPEGVVWSSSDTAAASIDSGGLASGLSLGTSTITATSGGVSGSTVLTVVPPNRPPSADSQTVTIAEDTFEVIALTASDPDGDRLTFSIVTPSAHGTLGAISSPFCAAGACTANVSYTPGPNFFGSDGFTFRVSDGSLFSDPVTVSIAVTPVNDPPTATGQTVTTPEDTPVAIVLTGSDPDGNPLAFSLVQLPAKGQLSGTAPNLTYTPNPDFNGSDSFTFRVHDGTVVSAAATVSITVTPVNDPPVANAGRDEVFQAGTTARIDGFGSDPEPNDNLRYTWEQVAGPATVTLTDPFRLSGTRLFVPTVLGNYTFRLTVSDGLASDSDEVVITIVETVLPVTLEPTQGPPGTAFTITDPHGRMRPGDIVGFVPLGASQRFNTIPAQNVVMSPDRTTLTGIVPPLSSGTYYFVTVTPSLEEPSRYNLPYFFVPYRPGEPSIAPTRGPQTTAFVISDPEGRLAFVDRVVFVEPGAPPEWGSVVERIFISADGTELIGQVPATALDTQNFVCAMEEFFPVFNCLSFLVAGDSIVTISPVVGPPGSTFFIGDPERRLRSGDQVLFYLPGSDPVTEGRAAGNVLVRENGLQLTATVPFDLGVNQKYFVSVRPRPGEPPRFPDLFFAVVEATEPFISPYLGPIGSRFTIVDPQGRMQPGDGAVFFVPFGGSPPPDLVLVPAEEVSVSTDGKTLTGRVPQGLSTIVQTHRVSVRPTLSGPSRFADLYFGVIEPPVDAVPPVLIPPPDLTVEGHTLGGAADVSIGTASVSDDIDSNPTVAHDAPAFFPLGTTIVTWTATDASGNRATATQRVTVRDTTPPTITSSQNPLPNANGWNNAPVTVTFTATDAVSAAIPCEIVGLGLTGSSSISVTLSNEGADQRIEARCTDGAGNAATARPTVRIDRTLPVVTVTRTPAPNANGWNNTDVTAHFTATDALSGNQGDSFFDVLFTVEGADQSATRTFTDLAGNSASAAISGIQIDKTPPVLTLPTLAASYILASSITLTFDSTDPLSQIAMVEASFNGAPIASGTTVTLNQIGVNTFALKAADRAGNVASETRTFSVNYAFGNFLSPLTPDGTYHRGRILPVKFALFEANGNPISSAVARLSLQPLSGGDPVGEPIEASSVSSADSGNIFRYSGGQYIYNLDTRPLSAGIWQLQVRLDDGSVHTIRIGLTSK